MSIPPVSDQLPNLQGSASALPLREQIAKAREAWLRRTPSRDTRSNYLRDLRQFLAFAGIAENEHEQLASVLPAQVAKWRDHLLASGLTNHSVRRKMTVLRSLYSYLQAYGYAGANPADSKFVAAPKVPRDGKTVGLSPEECRRLLDSPITSRTDSKTSKEIAVPVGTRDRALLAVLAYTGIRVSELCYLRVGDYKTSSGLRFLEVLGKGGKERRVPLHPEAVERIECWLECAAIRDDPDGPLFRPPVSARGHGQDGFADRHLSRRAVQYLVGRYVARLKLDPSVSVHSFRVTAITVGRERGGDLVDLQDFAGHVDPRTTLSYIRNRGKMTDSPAYLLKY